MRKTNISLAKKGMNRATYPGQLGEQEYTFAMNANLEDLGGDSFSLTNEHSNILATKFSEGFCVVGVKNDINLRRTFIFLNNPTTGLSEFGYIGDGEEPIEVQDTEVECAECDYNIKLSKPLEETTQVGYQTYVKLLSDCKDNKCFNFSILHPIKKIEIKTEKTGTIIVFTDNFNPPRYINLSKLESYSYTGEIICSSDENIVPTCLACDKLKMFRDFSVPELVPTSLISGGRLKMGTYEFLIAYSDNLGNEISEYYSLTNPIPIFDKNNSTLEQENLADRTNFAIKLQVEGLDKDYTHYKIAVIQVADITGATSYFEEGVHSINDDIIVYSSEENKKRLDISNIVKQNLFVTKWEGLTKSNNYLFGYGIELEKEINLQPVANLMGQFLKWQTHIAPEDLYQDGVNVSKFTGYNRDETVPFGIRFYGKNGNRTSLFNLVGRTPTEFDLQAPPSNNDLKSIKANLASCVDKTRDQRWKLYNDSTVEGTCPSALNIPTIDVEEEETKICYIENIANSTNGSFTVELNEPFTNVRDYIETNLEDCEGAPNTFGGSDLCTVGNIVNYKSQTCDEGLFESICQEPELVSEELEITSITGTSKVKLYGDSGSIKVVINNKPYPVDFTISLEGTAQLFKTLHEEELSEIGVVVTTEINVINLTHDADTEVKISVVNIGGNMTGEVINYESFIGVEQVFPSDYSVLPKPKVCMIYKLGTDGAYIKDVEFSLLHMWKGGTRRSTGFLYVNERDYTYSNEKCNSADLIANIAQDNLTPLMGYFHNYKGAVDKEDLRTNKSPQSGVVTTNFTDKIHEGALWFKSDITGKDKFVLEISKANILDTDDPIISESINYNCDVRVSIFNKCSDSVAIHSEIIPLRQRGLQYKMSIVTGGFNLNNGLTTVFYPVANLFPNNSFYVAVDNPIYPSIGFESMPESSDESTWDDLPLQAKFRTAPEDGCFSIAIRDIEYSAATISWENIVFRKKSIYTSICTYNQPIVQKCTALPYKYGKFAYYQSEEKYPDNPELFDSSRLKIKEESIPLSIRQEFKDSFVETEGDFYTLKEDTNLACKNIRMHRFPDNKVAPMMYANRQAPFANDIIYPLGVTIDEEVINAFLDIAMDNGLITKEQRENLIKYEILRGDISNDRSVQASGLLYDIREYKEDGKTINYSNYPFNDLGKDKLNLDVQEKEITQNNKYTFHSPETDFYNNTLPSEMTIQGYMFGKSRGEFNEVKSHPKWVILSDKGRKLAGTLATLEVAADTAIRLSQALGSSAQSYQVSLGLIAILNPVGIGVSIASIAAASLAAISNAITDYGKYRYEWLKVFRDLGQPHNFAYKYSGEGFYNYLRPLQEDGQSVRALSISKRLKPRMSTVLDENTAERITINNIDREESIFLSLGKYPINYLDNSLSEYYNYDNNKQNPNSGSLTYASERGMCGRGKSGEVVRNIASPYVALKNYIPNQYGTVGSIKWLSTGYVGNLLKPETKCLSIFGGDTFIGRYALKRKIPLFLVDAMTNGNMIPFDYSYYSNIGKKPRFYVNYEMNIDTPVKSSLFPDISNTYNLDCFKREGNYVVPSKFYLYYYGIPNFLCESRINTNFRYGKEGLKKSFYPDVGDIDEWTQEKNVSIKEPNFFYYNDVYSRRRNNSSIRTLPDTYTKDIFDKTYDRPNGVMYSLPDNDENNLNEPWLIYKPLDFYEFPSHYGKIKDLRGIESDKVLGRFENQTAIYNSVDVTVETGQKVENNNMGTGGIFRRRPVTFTETDLGYMGSQTTEMVSCEFGHFFADAKRGYVFKVAPGGKEPEEISSYVGGKPTGMGQWFKEHLPFKILKQFPEADTDNAMNGVGIAMGWDSRFKRVFLTKKDYILKPNFVGVVTNVEGQFYDKEVKIYVNDSNYFEDVSWTVAYSPILGSWLSYYDFKPNYYVGHNYYFQTGVNGGLETGLWSHLKTNKSYQVFYGKKYDFTIEYPDKEMYATRTLNNVNMWTEARRYSGVHDYSYTPYITFNEAVIYNNVANSGKLNLIPQKNNIGRNKNYPKTNNDNTQDIIVSNRDNFEWSFDYIFDRVKDNTNNQPKWLWDKVQVNKALNSKAISFAGKRVLSYLKGDYFLVNLTYNTDSRYKLIHKWSTQDYSV